VSRGVKHVTTITKFQGIVAYGSTLALVQMVLQNRALVSVMEVSIAENVIRDIGV